VYNALTAIETIYSIFGDAPEIYGAICRGIEKTSFPARFEIIRRHPLVILDGAHNISGVCALRETIKNLLPKKKITLVCGMLKDKNPGDVLPHIAGEGFVERFICAPVDSPRAESPAKLCEIAKKYCKNAEYRDTLPEALADVGAECAAVVFGSLYLAGETKKFMKADVRP
jgi:dihydrofolate synthase/folylpolyglutamate synthase